MKKKCYHIGNEIWELETMKQYFRDPNILTGWKCAAGLKNFIITSVGDVKLCFKKNPIGNIKLNEPKEIWESDIARELRKEIDECKLSCKILGCNIDRKG